MTEADILLTPRDLMTLLQVSRNTVTRMVGRGDIPAYRISGRGDLRFRQDDVHAWLERRQVPR